ncbi:hypothetical protein PR048_031024 [Dryococelus australis]|uniref:Uncharacterized protein n=1 Tax=Dryococelus australis TaxID=614101 RepID=A0ABQ9G899_9NEOP|nr:hypothetical protein PR048_031024 [Dryococelus australis]
MEAKLQSCRKKITLFTRATHGENGIKYTPEEKVEAIANSLELHFEPHHSLFEEVILSEARRTIHLKFQEHPGPDSIPNEALTNLPPQTLEHIMAIYFPMLAEGYYPLTWKVTKVITLHKPGKNGLFTQNCCPISLLNSMAKLFEKILYQ